MFCISQHLYSISEQFNSLPNNTVIFSAGKVVIWDIPKTRPLVVLRQKYKSFCILILRKKNGAYRFFQLFLLLLPSVPVTTFRHFLRSDEFKSDSSSLEYKWRNLILYSLTKADSKILASTNVIRTTGSCRHSALIRTAILIRMPELSPSFPSFLWKENSMDYSTLVEP